MPIPATPQYNRPGIGVFEGTIGTENLEETADLSTSLRFGRDDNSVVRARSVFPQAKLQFLGKRIVISTGGVMGLRPTQGN
jgi:hypothetical protein